MNNRPRIFIIEDVPEMASLISIYIEKADMQAFSYSTAEAALSEMKTTGEPDCLILDLNLPGMSGFDFLTRIRRDFRPTVPVVIVSARDADEDVIKGLGIGADEFVTKPFSPRVLVARIQAHLRRMTVSSAAAEESVRFGDYVLLLDSNVLKNGGRKIQLSVKEYAVLEYLIQNAGTSLSPEKIYTKVWKTQFGDMTAVAVYIQRLRKKIEKDPSNPMFIKTDFGNGYFFPKEAIIA
ncbi:MAG: response regulator transcription factor [Treponema porcinum]|uniref:response regulator transcription factor n=1 Tax=Treponema porcinum TaxID=261392 RepID=UPI0023540B47|nr:response regulator transcription factor [Treponema porcinum]MCI6815048.1 response regulator transcription factor [Treponema porcinum]MCI7080200.1 response regulator transcription factor [Treponema porcinum]MCI7115362.1 response regulator transcription factor [Treponema porcinum]